MKMWLKEGMLRSAVTPELHGGLQPPRITHSALSVSWVGLSHLLLGIRFALSSVH